MKRICLLSCISVVILTLFLISALGCGGATKLEKEVPGIAETKKTEPEKAEPEKVEEEEKTDDREATYEVFRVGDTVRNEKYDITANSARWVLADGSAKPDQGKKWLAISYSIESKTDLEFSISRLVNFHLYDEDGNATNIWLAADSVTEDGFIAEGQTMHGEVIFIVTEGQRSWEFVFNPDAYVFPNPGLGKSSFEIREDDIDK